MSAAARTEVATAPPSLLLPGPVGDYALLTDGACVQIRPAAPDDWQAVHDFAEALSRESVYRRFFAFRSHPGKLAADAVCAPAPPGPARLRGALLAVLGGAVVGVAEWFRGENPGEAEVAFATSDDLHGHGVATLLAEHLLEEAERAGIRRLTAMTQLENHAMLGVFRALGLPVRRDLSYGVWTLTVDLDLDAAQRAGLLDAAARRERVADQASLRHVLTPDSVAVIGDRADPATRAMLEHLRCFGGIDTAGPDGADLPPGARPDLAVITSPPQQAVAAARVCAERGVRALIVTAVGFDASTGAELLEICHTAGMRLLGPGSLGVANPGAGNGFGAVLSAAPLTAGHTGVAVQSGGVGLALLSHLSRLGVGISSFAGVGEKYDVSATDLLMYWQDDPETRLGLLHVDSFGNPRKFARIARTLCTRMPLLAVDPEQSPSQARTALYAQAGITVVPSLSALVAAAALLACQPAPRGSRVWVVGNTRGLVGLTVQALVNAGLDVVGTTNVTPGAVGDALGRAVAEAGRDDACDAVVLALAPTAGADGHPVFAPAADRSVPVLAVLVDQAETVHVPQNGDAHPVVCYDDASVAAGALAAAVAATRRQRTGAEVPAQPAGIDRTAARAVVESCLRTAPAGRRLRPAERAALSRAFGIGPGRRPLPPPSHRVGGYTVTAWQDRVFGPVLTCTRHGDPTPGPALLAPVSVAGVAELVRHVAGRPELPSAGFADLLARLSAVVDTCPQVATMRLDLVLAEDGTVLVTGADAQIAPAERPDPYLRRLRRAPVG
ncbi:MAG TPA: GNAT family N-acetyltransferase [Actinocrinis sp.]|nr:GNAT family N-acetyltransferase [Actinocrinis sp.]